MKGFYVHDNTMDVFIEVTRMPYRDAKRVRLKVRWWNFGYVGKPYLISNSEQSITIAAEDIAKWKRLTQAQMNTARTQPGAPT